MAIRRKPGALRHQDDPSGPCRVLSRSDTLSDAIRVILRNVTIRAD